MIPKLLKYGSKVESASARSSRINIAPQNGTSYGLGDTIIVNIPTRNNLVMVPTESYLKFNFCVKNTSGSNSGFRWDSCGAHGLIQRIRVYSGSNLIEDIDQYGLLAKMLFDLQVPTDASFGKLNVLAGTRSDLTTQLPTISTADATDLATAQALANSIKSTLSAVARSSLQTNSGEGLEVSDSTSTVIATTKESKVYTYCLNLISLMGSLCTSNYFPLFAASSSPIRIEIQLVDNIVKAGNALSALVAPTTLQSNYITNCEYVANFIELGDTAMQMIYASLEGQKLQFVAPAYKNFPWNYSLGTSATQIAMPISAKYSSLKSLFVTQRDQGTGASTYFPFSSVKLNISDYQFRVGSQILPAKAPATTTEMFAEVLKAIGSMSDINHQPSIDKFSYNLNVSTANSSTLEANTSNVNSGSFYVGLDLEQYASAPKDNIFAGWNSNTDDIFLIANYGAQGSATNTRFDAFALYDQIVTFENNTAYVTY